jgi:predicted RNase H-like HicB family nuclease
MDMGKLHYLAILERAESGGYGVHFPDFPGCVTGGDSELEAWGNAESILSLHVAGMIEDGEVLPAPSQPSMVERDPDVDEVARLLVGIDSAPTKVRVNVMLDANVLHAIDRVCENRSQFLSEAATAMLQGGRLAPAKPNRPQRRRRTRSVPMR